jgi:hypothetical protein
VAVACVRPLPTTHSPTRPSTLPHPDSQSHAGTRVTVQGGNVGGRVETALAALYGGSAEAEDAVLEARPDEGEEGPSAAVLVEAMGQQAHRSSVKLRRCTLRVPTGGVHCGLEVRGLWT